ncbi:MAG: restriction endonuclease subunit S [bacterium]|nr:restriction endonuclease subunit S [bacterium]
MLWVAESSFEKGDVVNWPCKILGMVADIIRGVTFEPRDISRIAQPDSSPVLRASNIVRELDTSNNLIWVCNSRIALAQYLVPNDVVITMSSGSASAIGKTAQLRFPWRGSVGAFCAIIRPTAAINVRYLYYWTKSPAFIHWCKSHCMGNSIKNLRVSDLEHLPVPLPPIAEQQRIVQILEQCVALRRKRAVADTRAQCIIPALFYKMFGDPATNSKRWPVATLGELSIGSPQFGANAISTEWAEGRPRYVRISDISNDGTLCDVSRTSIDCENWLQYKLEPGDVLFARSGNTVGSTYIHRKKDGLCAFAECLIRFKPDTAKLTSWYLIALTKTAYYKAWVESRQRVSGQLNLNGRDYSSLAIPCPPIHLQETFTRFAERLVDIREKLGINGRRLQDLHNLMLHHAFRGSFSLGTLKPYATSTHSITNNQAVLKR